MTSSWLWKAFHAHINLFPWESWYPIRLKAETRSVFPVQNVKPRIWWIWYLFNTASHILPPVLLNITKGFPWTEDNPALVTVVLVFYSMLILFALSAKLAISGNRIETAAGVNNVFKMEKLISRGNSTYKLHYRSVLPCKIPIDSKPFPH